MLLDLISIVATTAPIDGLEESPMALCPNKPLVAASVTSKSGCEIDIVDYEAGKIIARIPQESLPTRILFSPSGERIFLCNQDQRCEILLGPWSHPSRWKCQLHGEPNRVFDAAWLGETKILAVGGAPKRGEVRMTEEQVCTGAVWVAVMDAENGEVVLRQETILEMHDIMVARCSANRRVVFLFGDSEGVCMRNFVFTSGNLSPIANFEFRVSEAGATLALLDKGETLLCTNGGAGVGRIRLFASDGRLLDEIPSAEFDMKCGLLTKGNIALGSTYSWYRERWLVQALKTVDGKICQSYPRQTVEAPQTVGVHGRELRLAFRTGNQIAVSALYDTDIVQLASEGPTEAAQAAVRLAESRPVTARETLEERREEKEENLREAAVGTRASIQNPATLDFLIGQLGRRLPLVDRGKLFKEIEVFDVGSRQAAAMRALDSDSPVRYYGAIRVLEHVPCLDVLDRLCGALSDEDEEIRISAANGLAALADLRAVVALLSRLNEESKQVRQAVWVSLLETLRKACLLPERLQQSEGEPIDFLSFAQNLIDNASVGELAGSGKVVADLLDAVAGALVEVNLPLERLLCTIDALSETRSDFPQRTLLAVGLAVAFALADCLRVRNRLDLAETLYRRAASLAALAEVPQIAWRCWSAIGDCRHGLGNVRGAAAAYNHAMDFIDRLWFALLDEVRLRGFFQDKAQLYERAARCALELGHESVALETIERAKTRYLGDLIARRRLNPPGGLEKEMVDFWQLVELNKPERLPVLRSRLGPRERVALVGIKVDEDSRSEARLRPEKLGAFEDQVQDSGVKSDFLRYAWAAAVWTKSLENKERRAEAIEHLGGVYDALAALRDGMARGEWPMAHKERDSAFESYHAGANGAYNVDEEHLWSFREYEGQVKPLVDRPVDTESIAFLDALLEALDFALGRKAVFAVPALSEQTALHLPNGIAFVAQALKTRGNMTETERSLAVDRVVTRCTQGSWRHVSRLARGDIAGLSEAFASLGNSDCALAQFAVTEVGTAVFLCYHAPPTEGVPPHGPRLTTDGRFETLFLPEVTLNILNGRMAEGPESWFGRYRLLDHSEDQQRDLKRWEKTVEETLLWLSSELWAPIDERLQARGVRQLRLIPHHALHLVPFGALWRDKRPRGRERLVDAYELSYAPSMTLAEICRNRARLVRAKQGGVTLVADPEGDLPYARAEGECVTAHFDAESRTILEGAQATLLNLSKASTADIFHFAGHGAYDWEDPLKSQLKLADKPLTLEQLFRDALCMEGVNLVVLSGCETTVTNPKDLADEWLGLAAGFLFAGARQTISTLWAVDDLSTGMLFSKFYDYLLTEKLSAARSLQKAQLWLRDKADRNEAIRFAENAIALLRMRLGARQASDDEVKLLEGHITKIDERKTRLRGAPAKPFQNPFYWAAFTLSGAWDAPAGGSGSAG
jgi:CHAT domain-containing protein